MDNTTNAIIKFRNHRSIIKIKNHNEKEMEEVIRCLNINKPTTYNNIPAKILVLTKDICSPLLTKFYNQSKSVLPSISKIFERNMYTQIYSYMNQYLSLYLCGFRRDYRAQYCTITMVERWKEALDQKQNAGALLGAFMTC